MDKQNLIDIAKDYDTTGHPIMAEVEASADLWLELIEAQHAADMAVDPGLERGRWCYRSAADLRAMWNSAAEGKVYEQVIGALCKFTIMHGDEMQKVSPERQREIWIGRIAAYTADSYDAFQAMIASLKPDGTRDYEAEHWSLS